MMLNRRSERTSLLFTKLGIKTFSVSLLNMILALDALC